MDLTALMQIKLMMARVWIMKLDIVVEEKVVYPQAALIFQFLLVGFGIIQLSNNLDLLIMINGALLIASMQLLESIMETKLAIMDLFQIHSLKIY